MFFLSLTFLCLLQVRLRGCRLSILLDFSSWDVRKGQENATTIYRRKIQTCQVLSLLIEDFCLNSRFLRLFIFICRKAGKKNLLTYLAGLMNLSPFSRFFQVSDVEPTPIFWFFPCGSSYRVNASEKSPQRLIWNNDDIYSSDVLQKKHNVAKACSILWGTANCLARPTYFFGRPLLVLYWILIDIQLFAWSQYFYLLAVSTQLVSRLLIYIRKRMFSWFVFTQTI